MNLRKKTLVIAIQDAIASSQLEALSLVINDTTSKTLKTIDKIDYNLNQMPSYQLRERPFDDNYKV